jgi:hypothetical protein
MPYRYTWIAESPEAATVWGTHFAQRKKADKRTSTKATIFVPNNEWKYIVREGEDIIIRDRSTDKIVLMVIRNWCSDGDVLEWVSKIVNTAVGKKKSVRLDDPGKIVMMGYTSGACSSPTLGWAKNLLSKKTVDFTTPEELEKFDFQTSSTYALLWQMALHRLPIDILSDYQTMASQAMDANGQRLYWGIQVREDYFEFHQAELAPPQGNYTLNYCRYCHRETNATEYCMAWTTERQNPANRGSNFFVASYGVKVEASRNMMVICRAGDWYGTTLPDMVPERLGEDFCQLFFFIYSYLHEAYLDYGGVHFDRFPAAVQCSP